MLGLSFFVLLQRHRVKDLLDFQTPNQTVYTSESDAAAVAESIVVSKSSDADAKQCLLRRMMTKMGKWYIYSPNLIFIPIFSRRAERRRIESERRKAERDREEQQLAARNAELRRQIERNEREMARRQEELDKLEKQHKQLKK